MRVYPQESHADLGLVDNDRTPDLRPRKEIAPGRCWSTAEGQNTRHYITSREEVQ